MQPGTLDGNDRFREVLAVQERADSTVFPFISIGLQLKYNLHEASRYSLLVTNGIGKVNCKIINARGGSKN